MKFLITNAIRWPIGCLIFFMAGCNNAPQPGKLVVTKNDSLQNEARIHRAITAASKLAVEVKSGDIITRTGNDFTSQSLRKLCQRDQTYSHCGIASIENDSLFVYHAMGGEWNPDEKLRRDYFPLFAEPYSNNGLGIYRFSLPDSTMKAIVKNAQSYYLGGLSFDMKFDLKTDSSMYCAEFVYKVIRQAGRGQIAFHHSRIGDFEFIGPDDIFLHELCKKRAQIIYN
ncbi:MAG: hypothetical protein EOO06_13850 [Chitinophagaceae bacterium]|nr:MAG: hypothetical protein EOO06_13850 [Chitinophagaceae bacterium]